MSSALVTAIQQGLGNLRQVGCRIHPLRSRPAHPVEVRSQAHVVNAGDFRDVIDVINQDASTVAAESWLYHSRSIRSISM